MSRLSGHRPAARKRRRMVLIGAGAVGLGLATFLVLQAFNDSLLYFHLPSDVAERGVEPGRAFRLGGLVADGSVSKLADGLTVRFEVTDGDASLPVLYQGILPDLFREGQGIIADGSLTPDGHFAAETVLAKHDENYMPKDVYDRLKERGHPATVSGAQ